MNQRNTEPSTESATTSTATGTTKINSYLDAELWDAAEARAKAAGLTKREVIERSLRVYLSIPLEVEQQADKEAKDTFVSKLMAFGSVA